MILRSSTRAQGRTDAEVKLNDFIELRTYDATSKPWLARVVGQRTDSQGDNEALVEIECEWLWHARDAISELDISDADVDTYGTREVFLSEEVCDIGRDWNPLESVKWQVHVLSLEEYKKVVGARYRVPSSTNPSHLMTIDPSRCWYYRQICDPEKRTLRPSLPSTIHCPNPAFLEWCRIAHVSPEVPTFLDLRPNSTNPPQRSLCVPENPERVYYSCTVCLRRFKTRQGDCGPTHNSILASQNDPNGDTPIRLKSYINQPDVTFVCPMCTYASVSERGTTPSLPSETVPQSEPTSVQPKVPEVLCETSRKVTRYERFHQVFQKAISECGTGDSDQPMLYTDANVLCTDFFSHLDKYSEEHKLNSKMVHQKLHEIFQNLKRDNNVSLRRRIVVGDLTLNELLSADAKELAPESLKRRRQMEAQKYFKQQVLLDYGPCESKLIRKTHKGLEPVQDDSDAAFLPHSTLAPLDSPYQTLPAGSSSCSQALQDVSASNSFFLDDEGVSTEQDIQTILEGVQQRIIAKGAACSRLLSINHPAYTLWKYVTATNDTLQIPPPPEFTGVPSPQETLVTLEACLGCSTAAQRFLDQLKTVCPLAPKQTALTDSFECIGKS